jgi:hypothetical protein
VNAVVTSDPSPSLGLVPGTPTSGEHAQAHRHAGVRSPWSGSRAGPARCPPAVRRRPRSSAAHHDPGWRSRHDRITRSRVHSDRQRARGATHGSGGTGHPTRSGGPRARRRSAAAGRVRRSSGPGGWRPRTVVRRGPDR